VCLKLLLFLVVVLVHLSCHIHAAYDVGNLFLHDFGVNLSTFDVSLSFRAQQLRLIKWAYYKIVGCDHSILLIT
jgi:hypothetical protein